MFDFSYFETLRDCAMAMEEKLKKVTETISTKKLQQYESDLKELLPELVDAKERLVDAALKKMDFEGKLFIVFADQIFSVHGHLMEKLEIVQSQISIRGVSDLRVVDIAANRWFSSVRVLNKLEVMTQPATLFFAHNLIVACIRAIDNAIDQLMVLVNTEDGYEEQEWEQVVLEWIQRRDRCRAGLFVIHFKAAELLANPVMDQLESGIGQG